MINLEGRKGFLRVSEQMPNCNNGQKTVFLFCKEDLNGLAVFNIFVIAWFLQESIWLLFSFSTPFLTFVVQRSF